MEIAHESNHSNAGSFHSCSGRHLPAWSAVLQTAKGSSPPLHASSGALGSHRFRARSLGYVLGVLAVVAAVTPAHALFVRRPPTVLPHTGTSREVIGTTPTEIHAKFPGVIRSNLTRMTALQIAKITDKDFQAIYYAYARNTNGAVSDLTAIVRVRAPLQVARVTKFQNNALAAWTGTNPVMKIEMKEGGAPSPTLDMTLEEIYLEYRTATVGSLSVNAALYSTASYALLNLTAAYTAGSLIGSGIHWVIEKYNPAIDDAIGSAIDNVMNNLYNSTSINQDVLDESQLDQLFGVPVQSLGGGTDAYGGLGDWGSLDLLSPEAGSDIG